MKSKSNKPDQNAPALPSSTDRALRGGHPSVLFDTEGWRVNLLRKMDIKYPDALPAGSKARQDFLDKGKLPKGFAVLQGEVVKKVAHEDY